MFDALSLATRTVPTGDKIARLVEKTLTLGEDFAGVGLVFCDHATAVPNVPIYRDKISMYPSDDVCSVIADRSRLSNPQHDGFDLLTADWTIIELGVFLAPPITARTTLDECRRGSRHIAAALTSLLPTVHACVTISRQDRLVSCFREGDCIVSFRSLASRVHQ